VSAVLHALVTVEHRGPSWQAPPACSVPCNGLAISLVPANMWMC